MVEVGAAVPVEVGAAVILAEAGAAGVADFPAAALREIGDAFTSVGQKIFKAFANQSGF